MQRKYEESSDNHKQRKYILTPTKLRRKKVKIELDTELIKGNFSEGQIKGFMRELNLTYFETVLYLWFFNNVSITNKERDSDAGRPMYIKFAKNVGKLVKEQK